jgi:uncharacterized phage-associated protein
MTTYTANRVADTLIDLARKEDIEISNLKLQKLLYYAQAWSLVLRDEPLFLEDFEAWVHGPVVPAVFRRFKSYRWKNIDESVIPIPDKELQEHLREVLRVYGRLTPIQLERLSHSEEPWKTARKGLDPIAASNAPISKQSMKDFYSTLYDEQEEETTAK